MTCLKVNKWYMGFKTSADQRAEVQQTGDRIVLCWVCMHTQWHTMAFNGENVASSREKGKAKAKGLQESMYPVSTWNGNRLVKFRNSLPHLRWAWPQLKCWMGACQLMGSHERKMSCPMSSLQSTCTGKMSCQTLFINLYALLGTWVERTPLKYSYVVSTCIYVFPLSATLYFYFTFQRHILLYSTTSIQHIM